MGSPSIQMTVNLWVICGLFHGLFVGSWILLWVTFQIKKPGFRNLGYFSHEIIHNSKGSLGSSRGWQTGRGRSVCVAVEALFSQGLSVHVSV